METKIEKHECDIINVTIHNEQFRHEKEEMKNKLKRIEEFETIDLLEKRICQKNKLENSMCEYEKYQMKTKGELEKFYLVYTNVKKTLIINCIQKRKVRIGKKTYHVETT